MRSRAFETRSLPSSLGATHRGFAFCVAFPKSSIRRLGLPIYACSPPRGSIRELDFVAALLGRELRISAVAELADAQNASWLLSSELQSFMYPRARAIQTEREKTLTRLRIPLFVRLRRPGRWLRRSWAGQSGRTEVEEKIKRTWNVEEGRAVSFST
jgi:hypothetical protein